MHFKVLHTLKFRAKSSGKGLQRKAEFYHSVCIPSFASTLKLHFRTKDDDQLLKLQKEEESINCFSEHFSFYLKVF